MIIICTSVSQPWDSIRESARRRTLEIGTGMARMMETPGQLLPRQQASWAEDNIVASPEFASENGGYLVVATTYEMVVLRCLRRIRERYEGTGPQRHLIAPEIQVMCLIDRTKGGAPYQMLRVLREGEFMDIWAEGFFDERMAELF